MAAPMADPTSAIQHLYTETCWRNNARDDDPANLAAIFR